MSKLSASTRSTDMCQFCNRPEEYTERVRQSVRSAARVLDFEIPGWEDRVNTETLDIADCKNCILGQLFAEEGQFHVDRYGHALTGYQYAVENREDIVFRDGLINAYTSPSATAFWVEEI